MSICRVTSLSLQKAWRSRNFLRGNVLAGVYNTASSENANNAGMFAREYHSQRGESSFTIRRIYSHAHHRDSAPDAVEELNSEMEAVFGSWPKSSGASHSPFAGRLDESLVCVERDFSTRVQSSLVTEDCLEGHGVSNTLQQEAETAGQNPVLQPPQPLFTPPQPAPPVASDAALTVPRELSHVDPSGNASMVDVSGKVHTSRTAIASGCVLLGPEAFALVAANQVKKGDVLTVAQIAGINGAKMAGSLIPLCHTLPLSKVEVSFELNPKASSIGIKAMAVSVGPTGVEMEALTAVAMAALTVYDMCKAVSKGIEVTDVRLESKLGGKSGEWHRTPKPAS